MGAHARLLHSVAPSTISKAQPEHCSWPVARGDLSIAHYLNVRGVPAIASLVGSAVPPRKSRDAYRPMSRHAPQA
ncbi:unnamed protein product, partial [Iphiclides podalirius]